MYIGILLHIDIILDIDQFFVKEGSAEVGGLAKYIFAYRLADGY